MSRIAGVVLAAGTSSRLGRPKQLLMLDGKPLVVHVVERALASGLDEVVVVTSAHDGRVESVLSGSEARLVHNAHFAEGQASSLVAGIDALGADIDAAVILLGDQPGISPEVIRRVIGARLTRAAPVVMALYGEVRSHPVLFGREIFPELLQLRGDVGARGVIRAHRNDVVLVEGGAMTPPSDVDTEEAWMELQRSWPVSSR